METLISNPAKILVIQTAFPGDAILTLPMIQQLSVQHPESSIDVLCIPATAELFKASPHIVTVWELDKRNKHKSIFAMRKFINELKKNNYTKIYCPHRSLRSALITIQLGVKETYGFDSSSLKFAFKNIIPYIYTFHEVQRNLSLIGAETEGNTWKVLPEIKVSNEIQMKISEFVNRNHINNNLVVIAPGSVWQTKIYPVEYYKDIIKYLSQKNFKVVIIGGKDDEQLCNILALDLGEDVLNVCGQFSFVENIELLKYARLLICNDSAPTHLGMCADIPVLTLYCSTVPKFGFYPYNNKSKTLSYDELSCKPCGVHGYDYCPVSTFDCGKKLKPGIVINSIEEILKNHD